MLRSLFPAFGFAPAFGLAALLLGAGPAGAQDAGPTTSSVGVWTLKAIEGTRQCRVTLRADILEAGYALAMPAGCHRAFPILTGTASWTETGEGGIRFDDAHGQPMLAFEGGGDGTLAGTGPQGDVYRLEPVGPHRPLVLKAAARKGVAPAGEPASTAAVTPAARTMKAEDIPGHYAVLRDRTRDTGCMVTLDAKVRGPKSMLKANLAPACRDEGIRIFDPVGWQIVGGRLVLMARKGHTTNLDLQEDGTWLKDPKEGKSMGLKHL